MKRIFVCLVLIISIQLFSQNIEPIHVLSDSVWQVVGIPRFSQGLVYWINISVSSQGIPYVAYTDLDDSFIPNVLKYENNIWENVGTPGFVPLVLDINLALNQSDQPYVAFEELINDTLKVSVMNFNGTNWEYCGPRGFSPGSASDVKIAFDQTGTPYVAYYNKHQVWKASVMKFNGIDWEFVGNQGISESMIMHLDFAFSPSNEPYIAYHDEAYGTRESVMKFDGNNWSYVGPPGFSTSSTGGTSLAFNQIGQPYVAFNDATFGWNGTVMMFNGNEWIYIGQPGFTNTGSYNVSLAFGPENEPYVAFGGDFTQRESVMKFNGTNWIYKGNPAFSPSAANLSEIAFSPSGQPYVAFRDYLDYSGKITVMNYDIYTNKTTLHTPPFIIYPNPVRSRMIIEMPNKTSKLSKVSFITLTGQYLFDNELNDCKTLIDIESLPNGMYILSISTDDEVFLQKIVKE